MDDTDSLCIAGACALVGIVIMLTCGLANDLQYEEDYGLGSVVTTTAEHEYLTNDAFTGVVVRGEGWRDQALTVRNRDGIERRIATEFLEPMR